MAGDLLTDSFTLALRRFISRRGYPKSITRDNGTNFVVAQRELSEPLLKLDNWKTKDDLNQMYIIWKFNPPYPPWMGGAMESIAKIITIALKSIVRDFFFAI